MAKKRKADVGALTPEQTRVLEARLALQERAMQMAQAQMEREQAQREREAQFNAFGELAKLYRDRAGEVGRQFDVYGERVGGQREAALAQLARSFESGQAGITAAEQELMRNLVAGQAYQTAPLVELGQIQNPLMAGLQAEGASAAGVQAQTEQDRAMAAQLAALTRGAMGQLNVGEQNYLTALRNAGALAAAQARQQLAGTRAMGEQSIGREFDRLAQEIALQRLQDVGGYESQAAEAAAQQQAFTAPPQVDYAAQLEEARRAAMESIRRSLPAAGRGGGGGGGGGGTGGTGGTGGIGGAGPISGTGKIYIPYQVEGMRLTPQQLKRKREQEDLAALRARGK